MATLEWSDLINKLPRAPLAGYNADRQVGTLTSCSEGTRTALLQNVANWIEDPTAGKVFWLKERAGFGKTAVALSVAEHANQRSTLAASFFFSHQIADLNHASLVVPTITYQLSIIGGDIYKEKLATIIKRDPEVLHAKLESQIKILFFQSLREPPRTWSTNPMVIVIDALDECQRDSAEKFITSFIPAVLSLDLPFKVFITSRPEPHLITAFASLGMRSRTIDDTSNKDVETYLRRELADIPSRLGLTDLPRDWVTEVDIQSLLTLAGGNQQGGLFVYAATVIRFIGDPYAMDPQAHLQIVLSATAPSLYRPYQDLDTLYTRVLDVALRDREELRQRFHNVLGGMIFLSKGDTGLDIPTLERFLSLPTGEVQRTVINLQSVIRRPPNDWELPSFHHASFKDFLTNQDRAGSGYYMDHKLWNKRLALACMQVITSSALKGQVADLMKTEAYVICPKTKLEPEFFHATLCLPDYFAAAECDESLLAELETFIKDDFGWWIELQDSFCTSSIERVSAAAVC